MKTKGNNRFSPEAIRKTIIIIMMLFGSTCIIQAQLSSGGVPLDSDKPLQWVDLERVRVDELLLEDEWLSLTGKKNNRIAKEIEVSISPLSHGTWEQASDGTAIWKLGIRGKGARGLAPLFSRYVLAEGTRLFIYTPSGGNTLGAYTSRNNKVSGYLPVSYLPGEEIILQLEVPPGNGHYGALVLGSVRWAYLPVVPQKSDEDKYFGSSGSCNVDINCSLGDDWQVVKNSVVRMINLEKCTGVLINNVREDDKAYVYTAAHCVFQNYRYQHTVFYFNYESPDCDGPDGSIANSIAGATLVATGDTMENPRDADSLDFALLELSISPPDTFQPYYAGWNRSDIPAQHTTTIHHPSGDVKKIAIDYDPPEVSYHDTGYFEELVPFSHWRILEWDTATTEFGSSGCPLFDENQLIVGTLTGGQANCAFQKNDYFTRFDYAWDYYPEPSRQLKCWLDPDNTGVISMTGKKGGPTSVTAGKAAPSSMEIYPNPASDIVSLKADLQEGVPAVLSIYDITGRLRKQGTLTWRSGITVSLGGLDKGLYICRIRQDGRSQSARLMITR